MKINLETATTFFAQNNNFEERGNDLLSDLGMHSCKNRWTEKFNAFNISVHVEIFDEAKPTRSSLISLNLIYSQLSQSNWKYEAPSSITLDGEGGITIEFYHAKGNTDLIELDRDGSIERIQIRDGKVLKRELTKHPNQIAA